MTGVAIREAIRVAATRGEARPDSDIDLLAPVRTEFNVYRAGAGVTRKHGFGPNDTQKIWVSAR